VATTNTHELTKIAETVITRTTPFQKMKGLMFTKPIQNEAHIFIHRQKKRHTYHMSFVFYPIDILFVDENTVIDIKKSFLPFSIYTPKKPANKAIELPVHTVKKHNIHVGDTITH